MISTVLNAIRTVVSTIGRAGVWVMSFALSLPGGIAHGLFGGGASPAPLRRPEMASEPEVHTAPMQAGVPRRSVDQASVVWRYARAAVSGRPSPTIGRLAPEVRHWLESLDDDALERLASAGISRVSGHVRGADLLHGVPRVGDSGLRPRNHQRRKRDASLEEDFRFGPMLI